MLAGALRDRVLPALALATPRPPFAGEGRILIVQPDHLGDILLSEPAVRFLRHSLPQAELIAVVGPWSAEITRMAWPVDRIVEVEFPGFTRARAPSNRAEPYRVLRTEIERISELNADDAVILRDDAWWAAWLAYGAVGGHVIASPDPRTSAFATAVSEVAGSVHRTAIAMDLIRTYTGLQNGDSSSEGHWDMSPRLLRSWREIAAPLLPPDAPPRHSPLVVAHPGSGAAVKSWPVRAWRCVLKELGAANVVLTGTSGETGLCERIADGLDNVQSVAGRTSLPQLAALLERADVAIGTDNGPMHLAGALGTATVRLFGPSNPARYGPWPGTAGQHVLTAGWSCPRCEDLSSGRGAGCGCMTAIAPQDVIDRVREVLDDGT